MASAQVATPVYEIDLVPGEGFGFTMKFKKGHQAIPMVLIINNIMPMGTLPEDLLMDLGATKTKGTVTWPLKNGTLVTLPIYRVGPIFIGMCRIETTYFAGNTYGSAWIGKNLLEHLDYHGFLISQNKMVFSCPQET